MEDLLNFLYLYIIGQGRDYNNTIIWYILAKMFADVLAPAIEFTFHFNALALSASTHKWICKENWSTHPVPASTVAHLWFGTLLPNRSWSQKKYIRRSIHPCNAFRVRHGHKDNLPGHLPSACQTTPLLPVVSIPPQHTIFNAKPMKEKHRGQTSTLRKLFKMMSM